MSDRAELNSYRAAAAERAELESFRAGAAPQARPALGTGSLPELVRQSPLFHPEQIARALPIIAHALNQGATLTWGDEVMAALGAGEGDTIEARRQSLNAPYEEFRGASPEARDVTTALEMGGGLLTGIPGAVKAAVAPAARAVGSAIQEFVRRSADLSVRGAATGAVVGSGSAEPGRRAEAALEGGQVGAVLGAATPATVGALASGGRAVLGRVAQTGRDPERQAARILAKDVMDSGETAATMTAKAAAGSRDSAPVQLLDLLPALQTRAQSVYAQGGPGGEVVRKSLSDRAVATDKSGTSRASRRITRTLNNVIAGGTNWREAREALRSNVSKLAAPSYAEAYARQVAVTPEMANILATKDGRAAIAQAQRIGENEAAGAGRKFDRAELDRLISIARGESPGSVSIGVEGADLMKRSFDAIAQSERNNAFSKGGLGGTTPIGRSVEMMRSKWLGEVDGQLGGLDEAVNPYFRARRQYQGQARANSAMNVGMRLNRYTREELAEEMADMSVADRLHLRLGMLNNIRSLLTRSGARATRLLGDEGYNEKMQMVLGDDYRRVRAFLDTEKKGEESLRVVLGGSPTQPRLAAEKRLEGEQQELDDLLIGTMAGRPGSILSYGAGAVRRALGPSEAVNEELARMLTAEGAGPIGAVMRQMGAQRLSTLSPEQRYALERALLTGATVGAAGAQ